METKLNVPIKTQLFKLTANTNESVNWYDAPSGGNLLQSNSYNVHFKVSGTFYAEAYNIIYGLYKCNTRMLSHFYQ